MEKRLGYWNFYAKSYIMEYQPECSHCDDVAIGDYYDMDWNHIKLCEICYHKENMK